MIGVVGGMGPAAGFDLAVRLTRRTPAGCDADHRQVVVLSDPTVPSRMAYAAGCGPSPGPALAGAAMRVAAAGADRFVVVCNGAHRWLDVMEAAAGIPAVSLIGCTVDRLAAAGVDRAAVVCTSATRLWRLYDDALAAAGIVCQHVPERVQPAVDAAVEAVKAGGVLPARLVADVLRVPGDVLVAGCTELGPLLPDAVDPVDLTIERLLR
jgi:aspartate racemase